MNGSLLQITFTIIIINMLSKQFKSSACQPLKLNIALDGANGTQSEEILT